MINWNLLKIEDVLKETKTNQNGLSNLEAQKRLAQDGPNAIPHPKGETIFGIFFRQLKDPIVIILLVTVAFSLIVQEYIDALAIMFIILVDLILGTAQEWKAEKNAEALNDLIKDKALVMRDGTEIEIESSQLVLGDIVLLESGEKITADLRLIECHILQIDEASLTGESLPQNKTAHPLTKKTALGDQTNMAFAGTTVLSGRAKGVVVATALKTEIGKIADNVINADKTKSPLTIRMEKFSRQISLLIVVIAVIIAIILFSKNYPANQIFLSVIALAVAAMPEGLPLALTMALTIASNRMAKKNVIVKKLNSVESLGSCTVIASDKTGTLTVNQQTAKKIILPDGAEFNVTGSGYNDNGEIKPVGSANIDLANQIAYLGAINNEATLTNKNGKWQHLGDSIDTAFLSLALKAKIKPDAKIVGEIPYESANKFSAVFYQQNNKTFCTVKGSLEIILNLSQKTDSQSINQQNEKLAKDGYRVIAMAQGEIANFKTKENYDLNDINNLNFLGLIGFIDPVRVDAVKSIEACHRAGIKVIMITGDHPLTALSISRELGLAKASEQVVSGIQIEQELTKGEANFDQFIKDKIVFARVTPLQKLAIVKSYRRQGEFVAVTGDGVNDAPAIKNANIGVAMGSGTDVAQEAASMIIVDDKFSSIVAGIEEGRVAYSNIRKISYMLLSCGLAEVLFFILAIALNMPVPLIAIQLLWLNVVTDGLQDFALSFEKAENNIMKQPPRSTKESLFDKELLREVLFAGLIMGAIVFAVWIYLINHLRVETTVARGYIMTLMVFLQNMHVINARSERQSFFKISFLSNPMVLFAIGSAIVLQFIVMEVSIFSHFFKTESIPLLEMFYLFLISTIVLWSVEIYKKFQKTSKC